MIYIVEKNVLYVKYVLYVLSVLYIDKSRHKKKAGKHVYI